MEHQQACSASGKLVTAAAGIPRIHTAAYAGDLAALAACVRDGDDVNAAVDLPNENRHAVHGVTPLYLAAQAGHREACQLLVDAGADVLRQCVIPATGDVFGAADIALIHFNFKTWAYLWGVKRARLQRAAARAAVKAGHLAEPLLVAERSACVI